MRLTRLAVNVFVGFFVDVGIVACGASEKSGAPGGGAASQAKPQAPPAGTAAAAGPPFEPASVQKRLATAAANSACTSDRETFAAVFARHRQLLGGTAQVDETFTCRPGGITDENASGWNCVWTVSARPPATPDPDHGECCSNFQLVVEVASDGTPAVDTAVCVAAG